MNLRRSFFGFLGNAVPPAETSCVCVHQHLVVEASLSACLWLHENGSLWGVDNAAMTFIVASDKSMPPLLLSDGQWNDSVGSPCHRGPTSTSVFQWE